MIDYACDVPVRLWRPDEFMGLDWVNPCPHPVTDMINLTDSEGFLLLCWCHADAVQRSVSQPRVSRGT